MTDYAAIYQDSPKQYHRMVSAEDCHGQLKAQLLKWLPTCGDAIVDVGIGTGRVARTLLEAGASIIGVDQAQPMLDVCREQLAGYTEQRLQLRQGDARKLPVESGVAAAAVAGWTFGHLRHWEAEWQDAIGQAISEMARVAKPGGTLVIAETLGTGREQAAPPNQDLAEYYHWLENQQGFIRTTIATDYQFDSPQDAVQHMKFFFGASMEERILANQWSRVPEWTGIWVRR